MTASAPPFRVREPDIITVDMLLFAIFTISTVPLLIVFPTFFPTSPVFFATAPVFLATAPVFFATFPA
ncbi:hypothetical protein H1R20_g11699, partial [Candolleomyces eurysporus]